MDTNSKVQKMPSNSEVVIIGAGPAGLTAAYELLKKGIPSTVVEKDNIVGGLSRTVNYKGYHFDIGGHRFFTKVKVVEDMWHEVLGDDFLTRKRLSRIFYNNKFFNYPFNLSNALFGLGIWNSAMIVVSYLWAQVFPQKPENTFDQWVSNRFGKRLYKIFFETYTEKVWGIPCNEISAEWAAQRIKGLSLLKAIKNTLIKEQSKNKETVVKTLIDSFNYPKYGPGMMWEKVTETLNNQGSNVLLNSDVDKIYVQDNKVRKIGIVETGQHKELYGNNFISSMPIRELVQKIDPPVPNEILNAGTDLKYRDFLTVSLVINKTDVFPDNWIYIHDPDVQVGRIQNFKNWSQDMVPSEQKTCLGLEYFCFEGDGLWSMDDKDLIELGKRELEKTGLVDTSLVEDGTVVRMPKAYPVYDSNYLESLNKIREYLKQIDNLQLVGRNGMHKYNNQDHSMLTAMLAVKNILGANYDLWKVNADQEYHEEISGEEEKDFKALSSTQPLVPESVKPSPVDLAIIRAFSKLDKLAFATALGIVAGMAVFVATIFLILKGGNVIGPNLNLLGQYFIGYTVSIKGAFIGFGYSFLWAFIFGWLFAYLRNFFTGFYILRIKKKSEYSSFKDFIDYI
ncbi:MAG: hypothetical protein DHS20C13_05000 [Thermodesulfobacteriota bacterium]|nr:MAG: hypothetical protein DHS20C13_05000 [Thermodesulfobacteriota bacterium]